MTITSYSTTTLGDVVQVTVTSDLTGTIYYHWYLDGSYQGQTASPTRSFHLTGGSQARVECVDTNSTTWDPIANAPAGYPATRTLWWVRSQATDCDHYRIDQQIDGGAWSSVATIPHSEAKWTYAWSSDRLTDLSLYSWRIVPVDDLGNDGTPLTVTETIVRTPDAPDFTVSFSSSTAKVTFAGVA